MNTENTKRNCLTALLVSGAAIFAASGADCQNGLSVPGIPNVPSVAGLYKGTVSGEGTITVNSPAGTSTVANNGSVELEIELLAGGQPKSLLIPLSGSDGQPLDTSALVVGQTKSSTTTVTENGFTVEAVTSVTPREISFDPSGFHIVVDFELTQTTTGAISAVAHYTGRITYDAVLNGETLSLTQTVTEDFDGSLPGSGHAESSGSGELVKQ